VALGVGASLRHFRQSTLNKKISLIVVAAGLPGVILGANTILLIPEQYAKQALGILTIDLGVYSFIKPADELLALTGEQINWLLDGYDISLFKGHKKLHYDSLG